MAFVGGCIARAGPKRGWWDAVGLFAVYVVALVAGALWSRSGENSTVLWTASGVLTAGLLLLRPRTGWAFVATRAIRVPASPSAVMPVLAVTADVMRDDVERRRAAGMNSHVPKPINPARLMTALMTVLDGGESFPTAAPVRSPSPPEARPGATLWNRDTRRPFGSMVRRRDDRRRDWP